MQSRKPDGAKISKGKAVKKGNCQEPAVKENFLGKKINLIKKSDRYHLGF